jgi:hypothetical protein
MGDFGPPDQLLAFFDAEDYADVFTKITDDPERWTRAVRNSPLYARYVSAVNPTDRSAPRPALAAKAAAEAAEAAAAASVSVTNHATVDASEAMSPSANGDAASYPAPASEKEKAPTVTVPAQRSGQLDDEPTLQVLPTMPPPMPEQIGVEPTLARTRPNAPTAKPGQATMDKQGWRLFARNPSAPLRQYATLCNRMIRVILSDRGFALFLLAMPIVLAVLAYTAPGEKGLSFEEGNVAQGVQAQQLLVVLVTGAAFLGTAAAIREIVNEAAIYRRERAVGLSAAAYLSSKLTVFFLINTAQVALFVWLALFEGPPTRSLVLPSQTVEIIVAMTGIALVSTVLGLLISSLAKTTEQTTPIMVVLVMALLVFSGGLFLLEGSPVMDTISWFFPTRWGFGAGAETVNLFAMMPKSFQDPLFQHDADLWWRSMIFLTIQLVVLIGLTRLALRRHEPGRS